MSATRTGIEPHPHHTHTSPHFTLLTMNGLYRLTAKTAYTPLQATTSCCFSSFRLVPSSWTFFAPPPALHHHLQLPQSINRYYGHNYCYNLLDLYIPIYSLSAHKFSSYSTSSTSSTTTLRTSSSELLSEKFPYIDGNQQQQSNNQTTNQSVNKSAANTKKSWVKSKDGWTRPPDSGNKKKDDSDSDSDSDEGDHKLNEQELFQPPPRRAKIRYGMLKVLTTMLAGIGAGLLAGHGIAEGLRAYGMAPGGGGNGGDEGAEDADQQLVPTELKNGSKK